MLRTSSAAVVVGCFDFCHLDCDAAVETGCMLEKYIPAKGCNKIRVHFFFLVKVLLLLLLLRAAAAPHNINTEAERGTGYCLLLLRLRYYYSCFLCVYSIAVAAVEKGCMKKTNQKCYIFFFGDCAAVAFHSSRGMC